MPQRMKNAASATFCQLSLCDIQLAFHYYHNVVIADNSGLIHVLVETWAPIQYEDVILLV